MRSPERVVVTGMGVVSPCGVGVDEFHHALSTGRDGISSLEFPWETGARVNRAGVVRDFDVRSFFADPPTVGRTTQFALAAARQALDSAGLAPEASGADRTGVVVGTGLGDVVEMEAAWREDRATGPAARNGHLPAALRLANLGDAICDRFGLLGPAKTLASACAAGNHAIAWAADLLRSGRADAMLAIGADSVGYVSMLGFNRLLLQAPRRCQPFDLHRRGTIVAEGAGALLLETLASAQRRDAPILAELAGYGVSCDAGGAFASKLHDTRGMRVALTRTLRSAGISPHEIDHVSAHGSGTRLNDQKETMFLKEVLGKRAHEIPINSIKSMLGHTLGAAAMLEAVASVLTLRHGIVYPTIHYEVPDPACDLDYVPNAAREQRVDTILSNSFGVGGNNALVVLRRWGAA